MGKWKDPFVFGTRKVLSSSGGNVSSFSSVWRCEERGFVGKGLFLRNCPRLIMYNLYLSPGELYSWTPDRRLSTEDPYTEIENKIISFFSHLARIKVVRVTPFYAFFFFSMYMYDAEIIRERWFVFKNNILSILYNIGCFGMHSLGCLPSLKQE